jgi:hypothetical protein
MKTTAQLCEYPDRSADSPLVSSARQASREHFLIVRDTSAQAEQLDVLGWQGAEKVYKTSSTLKI